MFGIKPFAYTRTVPPILYLDQNAWVGIARGAWDKSQYPREHAALAVLVDAIKAHALIVPLTFTNLYETLKINDPARRSAMAYAQATISRGQVFRGRRRIFRETLSAYLANHFGLPDAGSLEHWFLSDVWFESVADLTSGAFDPVVSQRVIDLIRAKPAELLFDHLVSTDEEVRREAVRRYSASSAELLSGIETRRGLAAGESLALRKRAYSAQLIIDELEFILATGCGLGLDWRNVRDIGSPLMRKLTAEVPVLHVERELAVRIEDQTRRISENDLRDMSAFTAVLPFADIIVAEKPFVNLARQARLGEHYGTKLLTSIFDLSPSVIES
jgi:hypothetical protein